MAKPSENQARAFSKGQVDDPVNREDHDFYPTFPPATRSLLVVERFVGKISEPACGEGDISKVLESEGHEVISSDLIDRGYGVGGRDYLMDWEPVAPNVITNPPFRQAIEFVDRALLLTKPRGGDNFTHKVCLFLRLAFLEGIERGKWLPTTPLARIYVFSRRVPMERGGLPADALSADATARGVMAFAWFVWDWQALPGPPRTFFIDWKHPQRCLVAYGLEGPL